MNTEYQNMRSSATWKILSKHSLLQYFETRIFCHQDLVMDIWRAAKSTKSKNSTFIKKLHSVTIFNIEISQTLDYYVTHCYKVLPTIFTVEEGKDGAPNLTSEEQNEEIRLRDVLTIIHHFNTSPIWCHPGSNIVIPVIFHNTCNIIKQSSIYAMSTRELIRCNTNLSDTCWNTALSPDSHPVLDFVGLFRLC